MQTLQDTPLERRSINGTVLWVKREDLCWSYPPISKARGVWAAIEGRPQARTLAVVDTGKSLNGLLVTTIGLTLGREIIVGYPQYVGRPDDIPGPTLAVRSLAHGHVRIVPLKANRQFVMRADMQRYLLRTEVNEADWFLFPTGLRLPETVTAVEEQTRGVVQALGYIGTIVVPTGTGTHLAGVLRGFTGHVVAVQGYARPEARFRADVQRMYEGLTPDDRPAYVIQSRLRVVTSLCDYYEARPEKLPPWPANAHYEVKAYNWLSMDGVLASLPQPVVFWNIGQ